MAEQIKAWAVINKKGNINTNLYESEYAANTRLAELELVGKFPTYKIIELTSTPKIKMTQAEWDEFEVLKRIRNNETFYITLAECIETTDYPLLDERFYNNSNAQLEFAKLWASDTPEELVEIAKEKRYWLITKLDDSVYAKYTGVGEQSDYDLVGLVRGKDAASDFNEVEIEKLGGFDFLYEMGLKKVEVTE